MNLIQSQFPILSRTIYGKPLVYLDNAATTQKPQVVLDAIQTAYTQRNANIHRGVHFLSQEATIAHESARDVVRDFIHARSSKEIIFTRGTTEGINLVASCFGQQLQEGDEIMVSMMEHHSNIVPWQLLSMQKNVKIVPIPFDENGELEMEEFRKLFSKKTKFVSIAHVSNALGTVNPVKEIIAEAHRHGALTLVDGAQSTPHISIDVQDLDCDFFAFSGHKIYGPTGIGILYGKESLLNSLPPYMGGGEMIEKVSFSGTTFNELPYKYEAGTPDYVGSTALAAALRFVSEIGMEKIAKHEQDLLNYCTERLHDLGGVRIIGQATKKSGLISFLLGDVHPFDVGTILDKLGIAVRTGHHCAQPVMERMGIEGTVRASFALYNTKEDIDVLIEGLLRVKKMFRM
ncbi:MAG: cysteine desulfurase [Paludibacteraceae bacterium]|nr:cysteine desulfurase [Paludibacteraceae bacterium]